MQTSAVLGPPTPRKRWFGQRWALTLAVGIGVSGCVTSAASTKPCAQAMAATGARGLAIAVVDGGQVVFTRSLWRARCPAAPLREDTVMYGASLTKAAFGYLVMQLVEEGRLGLDVPHRPTCRSPCRATRPATSCDATPRSPAWLATSAGASSPPASC
jgi:CubicO group peptidase (beta-lactamase class C family)